MKCQQRDLTIRMTFGPSVLGPPDEIQRRLLKTTATDNMNRSIQRSFYFSPWDLHVFVIKYVLTLFTVKRSFTWFGHMHIVRLKKEKKNKLKIQMYSTNIIKAVHTFTVFMEEVGSTIQGTYHLWPCFMSQELIVHIYLLRTWPHLGPRPHTPAHKVTRRVGVGVVVVVLKVTPSAKLVE